MSDVSLRAIAHRTVQVGPEDWERQTHVRDLTPGTTVEEIVEWHSRTVRRPRDSGGYFSLTLTGQPTEAP